MATVGPPTIGEFALAPDDIRIAANVGHMDSATNDLWLFDSQRPEGTRLTFSGSTGRPLWAADGRHLYFRNTSPYSLWVLAPGATDPVRVENSEGFHNVRDVTRDGRYLVFTSSPPRPEVWIQRVGDPSERRALVRGQFPAPQARVSPDGRWLAFTMVLSGGPEVFVQPFDRPGQRVQISRSGGFGAIWRGDGRELYYEGTDGLMT